MFNPLKTPEFVSVSDKLVTQNELIKSPNGCIMKVKKGDEIMDAEIKKALLEKLEELKNRKYSKDQHNHYLEGLLAGLRMTDTISQEERYYILDAYSK